MPRSSRSSSLSSLSSLQFLDEEPAAFNSEIRPKSPIAGFEVVIESKSPREANESMDYEQFPEAEIKQEDDLKKEESDSVDDDEEILPDHWYGSGKIPVFKPTMKQFESFPRFVDKINHYGMRSGIVKIIAPQEWLDALPPLDEKVKEIKIKNPIVQHIGGHAGTYRQANVEKQRTYNLVEWRRLCESSEHQPPARRGERRHGQAPKQAHRALGSKRGPRGKGTAAENDSQAAKEGTPPTPKSPSRIKDEDEEMEDEDASPAPKRDSKGRQPRKSGPAYEVPTDSKGRQPRMRTRNSRRFGRDEDFVDDSEWEGFDYRAPNLLEYTQERCEEMERAYWRTLTYNNPLYGADMPGSLFDDSTTSWNVAKLPNILDCLGAKLPGVNTAYLYLGMWKSTFAWHLEDVDLYSINYIHFGAPKQWYSISQEDAPKFEAVMKNTWPQEAKKCSQFLRHKTFLISPSLLQQKGIRVNKLVHYQGEFVITFPYGYHSGYNLGYNCAESVNFATESWLDFGRVAKKCECIDDAVWVDVADIERRLRGEVTEDEPEKQEAEGSDIGMEDVEEGSGDLPTPPESVDVKPRNKRTRKSNEDAGSKKRIRRVNLKVNVAAQRDHCILCPNYIPSEEMLETDNGKKAHRLCALYTPETYFSVDPATGKEVICNISGIPKGRLELRCVFCKTSGKGACFQCSHKKCVRGYHATCAAAAGVLVEMREAWVKNEQTGQYMKDTIVDFQCKFHRPKRNKDFDGEALEENSLIADYGKSLIKGDVIQMQFYRSEIFAGVVVENRLSEGMVLVDLLPKGGQMEVEWKWILVTDPSSIPPLGPPPASELTDSQVAHPEKIEEGNKEAFGPRYTWGEFSCESIPNNPDQVPVDTSKSFWYYLGEQSTECIPKYSADPEVRVPDDSALFLPKPVKTTAPRQRSQAKPKQVAVPINAPPPPHPYPYSYTSYQPPQGQTGTQGQQQPQLAVQGYQYRMPIGQQVHNSPMYTLPPQTLTHPNPPLPSGQPSHPTLPSPQSQPHPQVQTWAHQAQGMPQYHMHQVPLTREQQIQHIQEGLRLLADKQRRLSAGQERPANDAPGHVQEVQTSQRDAQTNYASAQSVQHAGQQHPQELQHSSQHPQNQQHSLQQQPPQQPATPVISKPSPPVTSQSLTPAQQTPSYNIPHPQLQAQAQAQPQTFPSQCQSPTVAVKADFIPLTAVPATRSSPLPFIQPTPPAQPQPQATTPTAS